MDADQCAEQEVVKAIAIHIAGTGGEDICAIDIKPVDAVQVGETQVVPERHADGACGIGDKGVGATRVRIDSLDVAQIDLAEEIDCRAADVKRIDAKAAVDAAIPGIPHQLVVTAVAYQEVLSAAAEEIIVA